jgi:hypothetical protein
LERGQWGSEEDSGGSEVSRDSEELVMKVRSAGARQRMIVMQVRVQMRAVMRVRVTGIPRRRDAMVRQGKEATSESSATWRIMTVYVSLKRM